jgi:L-rhamnose-H+ transport protein
MGVLWMGGVALYGAGASSLGKVGSTVAWIILMAMTVFAGNVWGLICGEWRGASVKALRPMIVGLTFLMVSIILVSIGNYLL